MKVVKHKDRLEVLNDIVCDHTGKIIVTKGVILFIESHSMGLIIVNEKTLEVLCDKTSFNGQLILKSNNIKLLVNENMTTDFNKGKVDQLYCSCDNRTVIENTALWKLFYVCTNCKKEVDDEKHSVVKDDKYQVENNIVVGDYVD